MIDCTQIERETMVICKSGNWETIGFDGYIKVSLEVMLILAGATRKTNASCKTCHIRPQYLLIVFFLDMSPNAKKLN